MPNEKKNLAAKLYTERRNAPGTVRALRAFLRLPQTDPSTIKRAKNIRTKIINTYLKTSNDREHAKETLYNSAIPNKILKKISSLFNYVMQRELDEQAVSNATISGQAVSAAIQPLMTATEPKPKSFRRPPPLNFAAIFPEHAKRPSAAATQKPNTPHSLCSPQIPSLVDSNDPVWDSIIPSTTDSSIPDFTTLNLSWPDDEELRQLMATPTTPISLGGVDSTLASPENTWLNKNRFFFSPQNLNENRLPFDDLIPNSGVLTPNGKQPSFG